MQIASNGKFLGSQLKKKRWPTYKTCFHKNLFISRNFNLDAFRHTNLHDFTPADQLRTHPMRVVHSHMKFWKNFRNTLKECSQDFMKKKKEKRLIPKYINYQFISAGELLHLDYSDTFLERSSKESLELIHAHFRVVLWKKIYFLKGCWGSLRTDVSRNLRKIVDNSKDLGG